MISAITRTERFLPNFACWLAMAFLSGGLLAAGCEQEAAPPPPRDGIDVPGEADRTPPPPADRDEQADRAAAQQPPAQQPRQPRGDHQQWDQPPEMQIDPQRQYHAVIRTNHGEMRVRLFPQAAPKTVNNFVFLARENFYDGVIFHRVIENFMIQGGDPTGTGRGGPGYSFEDEIRGNPHRHDPFTLSMANAGPNTNGSQFFITTVATPHLDPRHTVFGRVVEGEDVVRSIARVETGPGDRPVEEVVIETIEIEEGEEGEGGGGGGGGGGGEGGGGGGEAAGNGAE